MCLPKTYKNKIKNKIFFRPTNRKCFAKETWNTNIFCFGLIQAYSWCCTCEFETESMNIVYPYTMIGWFKSFPHETLIRNFIHASQYLRLIYYQQKKKKKNNEVRSDYQFIIWMKPYNLLSPQLSFHEQIKTLDTKGKMVELQCYALSHDELSVWSWIVHSCPI